MEEHVSPMIEDRELWACANTVLEQHGENVAAFIAERIGALALEGDERGIAAWKAIAHRVDQLQRDASRIAVQ